MLLAMVMLLGMMPVAVLADNGGGGEENPPVSSEPVGIQGFVDGAVTRAGGYTVTFLDDDGSEISKVEGVAFNTDIDDIKPNDPTKPGYTFTGWRPSNVKYIQADTVFTAVYRSTNIYTLIIKYQYEDGSQAAQTHVDTLPSNYAYSITSPTVVGYTADRLVVEGNTNTWDPDSMKTITVTYEPSTGTPYKVVHRRQALDGSYPDPDSAPGPALEVDELTATTGASVTLFPKDYTGFTLKPGTKLTGTVAADGSTVFVLDYERNSYTITYDSQNGSYIPPAGYLYGQQTHQPDAPVRTGYTFEDWFDDAAGTGAEHEFGAMPANSFTLYAKWTPQTVNYTVVYWLQNPNDNGYSFHSSEVKTAAAGSTVSVAEADAITVSVQNANNRNVRISEFSSSETATVKGDGTTILNVYLNRVLFKYVFSIVASPASSWYTWESKLNLNYNGAEYTHASNPQYSFSARYEQNIGDLFPVYGTAEILG